MMTLTFAFWLFVTIFAVIGGLRGWAKELIVTFSVVLAMFFLEVLGRYFPPVRDFFAKPNGSTEFWMRAVVVFMLSFFGYQTPNITKLAGTRFARERLAEFDQRADRLCKHMGRTERIDGRHLLGLGFL